ncbi:hypothetical protein DFJ69_5720 [Thermomonospora umbrina]|uniref:Uncharacterized protein n=1 Tax=Thermomonospora umbrina TaxID=111806 RepID=A0A3D9T8W0_9ACTN|nr:hypothetical protein DFJ69_5720 [Thermomonospora umbrina]
MYTLFRPGPETIQGPPRRRIARRGAGGTPPAYVLPRPARREARDGPVGGVGVGALGRGPPGRQANSPRISMSTPGVAVGGSACTLKRSNLFL